MGGSAVTLTEFLLARIDEDAAVARKVIEGASPGWLDTEEPWWCDEQTEHVAMPPARVLADCKAKRRIVEDSAHLSALPHGPLRSHAEWVTAVLALPYVDHPDYREEWKP